MKACVLTTAHSPLDDRIFEREARSLASAGYQVTVVAPWERDEEVEGVRILGVGRASGRASRILRTAATVVSRGAWERAHVYHFHDPELVPWGVFLKVLRKRVIYDVHEDLPRQIASKHWIPLRLRRPVSVMAGQMERVGACLFDVIVAATPAIARRFPPGKTVTVQNFPVLSDFRSTIGSPYARRPPLVAYVGGVTVIRGVREIMDAMALLPASLEARLALAGTFDSPHLERELRDRPAWRHVTWLGWCSREQIEKLLGGARIGLVTLHPTPSYVEAYPVKLFEYMAMGIPVVASHFPLWSRIVGQARCGLLVDPLSPREIAGAIQWLLENPTEAEVMGRRGRQAVEREYNWGSEEKKLLALYARLDGRS